MKDTTEILNELNQRFLQECEELINKISDIIKKLNPIELIESLSIIAYISNNNENNSGIFPTAYLEYICGLVLSTKYEVPFEKITSDIIHNLINYTNDLFIKTSFTNFSNKYDNAEDNVIREQNFLTSSLKNQYLFVRGDAQFIQIKEQVQCLFGKYDEWMIQNEEFTINDAVNYIEIIRKKHSDNFFKYLDSLFKKSEETIDSTYKDFIKGDIKKNKYVRKFIKNYRKKKGRVQLIENVIPDIYSNTFSNNLTFTKETVLEDFDIVDEENFFKFVDRFCCHINQNENSKFRSPLDNNIFKQKSIIHYDNKYIIPNFMNLIWALQYEIENDMKKTSIWDSYQKNKGKYLEKEVLDTFKKIMPTCESYDSLFYDTIDEFGNKKRCELDSLVIYDCNIFLIESKSGIFRINARKGYFDPLSKVIYENIEYAFDQASRARDYIKRNKEAKFFNKNGSLKVTLESKNYSNYFLINVTLENFGEIATRLHRFKYANIYINNEFPWSINIHDLKAIGEFIEFPTQFIHYIHRRLKINNRPENLADIFTSDELDFFGHYMNYNLYFDESADYNMIALPDYSQSFNEYYHKIEIGEKVNPFDYFSYKMIPEFKKIMFDLERFNQLGYTKIMLSLLELSGETRKEFIKYYNYVVEKAKVDDNIHDATLLCFSKGNDTRGLGITLMAGSYKRHDDIIKKLEGYSRLKKHQQKVYEWISFGIYVDEYELSINECMHFEYEEEYSNEMDQLVSKSLKGGIIPKQRKIGRNELCPCGSGKKYKRCHGK